ncbi:MULTISPECIES: NACHT domain-containing protein [unclassified Streptomyces]|uniref:NACHT domain-containing protein n=1 Tax=unclassified Streptomyces TaxID=2593676 RepID=UPI0033B22865
MLLVLVAVCGASVLGIRSFRRRRAGAERFTEEERAAVLRSLRHAVLRDWAAEAEKRGLTPDPERPRLLHTQWAPAPPESADGRSRGLTGSTADMPGLVECFSALAPRRLVIVGPAGSGKSTLLILILLELCRTDDPFDAAEPCVPVLFSLSSYDPRRHALTDWLAGRLVAEYPQVGSVALARDLLLSGRILACLDGLDEIPGRHLTGVLRRVGRAFAPGLPVILACRDEEYAQALRTGPVLYGAAVTEARELAFPHVLAYLRESLAKGGPLHRDWTELFGRLEHGWGVLGAEVQAASTAEPRRAAAVPTWALLAPEARQPGAAELWRRWTAQVEASPPAQGAAREVGPRLLAALGEALTSPLTATLFTDLYAHAEPAASSAGEGDNRFRRLVRADPARVRDTILDNAVRVLFDHRLTPDTWPDARRHLSFLARHLRRTDRTDLAWWELSRALPHSVYGVLLGLLAAVGGGLTTASAVGARQGAVAALQLGVAGLVTGLLVSAWGPENVASWLDRLLAAAARWRAGGGAAARAEPRRMRGAGDPRFGRTATALAVGGPMGGTMGFLVALQGGAAWAPIAGLLMGLIFGIAAGLLGAGGPVRGPRWFRRGTGFLRRLWEGTRVGAGAGAVLGLLFWAAYRAALSPGTAEWERTNRPTYMVASVLASGLFGAALGLLSGILKWLQTPAPADDSTSPRSLLRGDRRLVAGWGLVVAGLFGGGMSVVMASDEEGAAHVAEGVVLLVILALWVAVAVRTWPRYVVARYWLWMRGDLPSDFMGFLEHAHTVSALRQVGGVYQFRHKDLQDHLGRSGE